MSGVVALSSHVGPGGSKCVPRGVLGRGGVRVPPVQVPNQIAHVPHPTQYMAPGMQAGCPAPRPSPTLDSPYLVPVPCVWF